MDGLWPSSRNARSPSGVRRAQLRNNLLESIAAYWQARATEWVVTHRRRVVAGISVALGAFTVTAFGVAPLMPDPAALPQALRVETVSTLGLAEQLDALAAQDLSLRRNTITRGTDGAEALLLRLGISDASAAAFLRSDGLARRGLQGRGGKMVQAEADANGALRRLVARFPAEKSEQRQTHFTRLTIDKVAGAWQSRLETAALGTAIRMAGGTIRSSLFAATDELSVPDAVAVQLAEIFSTDIDFHRQLRKGDTFSVVYEALQADGETVAWGEGAGRVLAAEFVNAGRVHRAVWFVDSQGRGGYYGPDGESRRRAFLASPLEFSRVTSGFAMRFHPLLRSWRAHLGVDYGAPVGTPVRVVGDGIVAFAGRQNGYGNVVEVRHGNNRSTLYAHLSRIDVRRGQHVEQGEHIGAVGATGWATGPHLHFEFHVDGKHQDPLAVAKASEALMLDPADKGRFDDSLPLVQARLQIAESLVGARPMAD